jgi:hypothetical protein
MSLARARTNKLRWSRRFERRVALYEECATSVAARMERLARERERGLAPLLGPLPEADIGEQMETGAVTCVVCRRDHLTEAGPELMTQNGATVCWPCGRAGLPNLTALVLAEAADHAERAALDICESTTAFLLESIRVRGNPERAESLRTTIIQIQALLRDSRQHRQTDPSSWLALFMGVEDLEQMS